MSASANSNSPTSDKPILRRKRSSFSDVFKILVVGAENVGKSALVVRFLTKKFIGEYGNNVDNKYRHSDLLDHDQILIEIGDTCCKGSGEMFTNADNMKWADGFMFVYSITDKSSLAYLESLKNRLLDVKRTSQFPVYVIGNKTDMEHMREVSKDEGEEFALNANFIFCECSVAEEPLKVREAFMTVCKEIALTKRRSRTFLDRVLGGIGGHKK